MYISAETYGSGHPPKLRALPRDCRGKTPGSCPRELHFALRMHARPTVPILVHTRGVCLLIHEDCNLDIRVESAHGTLSSMVNGRHSAADVVACVAKQGGIVRRAVLTDHGFPRRVVDQAVAAGLLLRPRRGWIALPRADRMLLSAARFGVVITCRTQAARLGLWVHDKSGDRHVAVDPSSTGRQAVRAKIHWGEPLVPRAPGTLADPIENVLGYIAECEPFEQALATWNSAFNKGLVQIEAMARLPLRPKARRVLAHATPFADAGLETYLRIRLYWLRVPLRMQTWISGHRVDMLIGDRLIVQVDGATHTGEQRTEDIRHDAELRLLGYHVVRVSCEQIMFGWPDVQEMIMRAVAQRLHVAA